MAPATKARVTGLFKGICRQSSVLRDQQLLKDVPDNLPQHCRLQGGKQPGPNPSVQSSCLFLRMGAFV